MQMHVLLHVYGVCSGRSYLCCRIQAPAVVAALLERLGLSADDTVRVEVNGGAPSGAAAEVWAAG